MKRWSTAIMAALLLAPAAAQAQRPSNNVHTRSADVYLNDAFASNANPGDRLDLLTKAVEAARKGTQNDPDNPKPWYQLGRALAGLGHVLAADSALDRAEAMYPEYAEEIEPDRQRAWILAYNKAAAAVQAGNVAEAVTNLEAADAIYRKRPEALVTLGSLYMQEGQDAKAEQAFRDALTILRGPERAGLNDAQKTSWAEDEINVSMRLANLFAEKERYADAETVYRELIASQPDNTTARANLALILGRAGKMQEASVVYNELLSVPDLNEVTLFNIGIGLYRAERFSDAAGAFRRALEKNPHSHDTQYNLAQALLAQAGALNTEKASAAAPRVTEINTSLTQIYNELLGLTDHLASADPANRQILMIRAESQRNLGELGDGAAAQEWREKVLATLEAANALPFEVSSVIGTPGDKQYMINGRVTNLKLEAGTPVKLRFIILDNKGAEIATEEITVTAPVTEESTNFNTTIEVPEGAAAWKYVIVQ